jgi:hypothetical protein
MLMSSIEISKRLEIRVEAAKLSRILYEIYNKSNKIAPEVIEKWKSICQSDDEFVEIKNSWEIQLDRLR